MPRPTRPRMRPPAHELHAPGRRKGRDPHKDVGNMNAAQPHRQGVWPSGLALLGTCVLMLALSPVASGLPSRAAFRAQRLCSNPRPGTAACLGMRLVLQSAHERGPAGEHAQTGKGSGAGGDSEGHQQIRPERPHPAGPPCRLLPSDGNGRLRDADDRGRRRIQRPHRRSRPGGVRHDLRPTGLYRCQRLLSQAQRAGQIEPAAGTQRRMGERDIPRRADGSCHLPELSAAARGGQKHALQRSRRRRERRGGRGGDGGQQLLRRL